MKDNIVLIGMPSVGKSTAGVVLAKIMGMKFVDTDLIIQQKYKQKLHNIIEERGTEEFLRLENETISKIEQNGAVIATGGSVVYGEDAMRHLKEIGTIVYLDLDFEYLKKRLHNIKDRGVVLKDGQSIRDIYDERYPLYIKYADIIIDENSKDIEQTIEAIIQKL